MFKYLFIAKFIVLAAALVVVIWAMNSMNAGSVSRALSALGIEAGAGSATFHPASERGSAGAPAIGRLNLCKTRVKAFVWSDGKKVEERIEGLKMTWMAHDPSPREIGYLEMEKWLGQHCQIETQALSQRDQEQNAYSDELVIRYIDGSEIEVRRAGEPGGQGELFLIGGDHVRSHDFAQALEELRKIAQLGGSTRPGPKAP